MTDHQEPFSDRVFHHLLSMNRLSRQYSRQITNENNLTPREFSVLILLLEIGSATVGQVQILIHKSASTTSKLIAQLEEKGYVTRSRSDKDKRFVIVELTTHGHKIAKNTPLGGLPLLRRLLNQLPEKRLAEIDNVLTDLMQMMKAAESK